MSEAFGRGIRISEVRTRSDLQAFLDLPSLIYRNDPHWIPSLRGEIRKILDRRRNPFFDHGEACYWLAWRGGVPVGRISAQVNRLHLDLHQDATGNFGFIEALDDAAVFTGLLNTAERWLRERGMARIVGPYSLSINDEIGLPVSGPDAPPVIGMPHAPRYYLKHLEAAGYRKAKDVHALIFEINGDIREVDRLERVTARLTADRRFRVRPIDMRRFEEEMREAIEIYNDAWSDNWGFVPVTPREVESLIETVRPIIQPRYVLLGELDGRLEGIFVTLPNLNEMIGDLGGRLLPFGWVKLLWRLKTRPFKSGRVVLAGVRKAHRNSLVSPALLSWVMAHTIRTCRAAGIEWLEFSWVIEDNTRSMALCQRAGGRVYKTYRIYGKDLA